MTTDQAERLAIDALGYLAGETKRLDRFLALTGLEAGHLREAAVEPAFLAGVLAHIAGDERNVVEFSQATGHRPDALAQALAALRNQPDQDRH